MKNNFEELDQRFLEITRDLTNSLGHELLTDELIVVKEHLFNLIHQYHRIADFVIDKESRELKEKIDKLRSRENHWKGLENYDVGSGINEDINSFTNMFRQTYRSGKMLTFRQWCDKIEELLDTLND